MENQQRIIVPYSGNTLEQIDWAQGAAAFKKSIRKGKTRRVTSLSNLINKTRRRAIQFFILGVIVLLLAIPMIVEAMYAEPLYILFHMAVILYEFGLSFFHIWLYLNMKKSWKRIQDSSQLPSRGGRLFFDDYGIEDTTNEGRSARLPWRDYEMCVIIHDTIVIMMSGIINYLPADRETEIAVRDALAAYGKADTIFDCRQKQQ